MQDLKIHNYIIEKNRFRWKKAATIRVVALVVTGSEKEWVKAPKFGGVRMPAVQFGSVPPYSLVVQKIFKTLKFGNNRSRRTVW